MAQFNPLIGTLKAPNLPQRQAEPSPSASKNSDWDFSFHNLLSIVNPLQHLPGVATIYRAITGDKIGMPEKIAGDALYGGLWGAIAGAVDVAFEAVTGKDVGNTVLAMFTGKPEETQVALAASAAPTPLQSDAALTALTASLNQKGVENDIAQRALAAYRKSMMLPDTVLAAAR